MAIPATGGTPAQTLLANIDPTKIRYGQIVGAYIRDYLDASGNPRNLADPACGLGTQGVFTPFATDGSIRLDLQWNAPATNQGWYNLGYLKEDSVSISPEQTVQQTPSAQSLRTARNIFTKLDDKVSLTPLENSNLIKRLRFNLPLTGFVPDDGTTGYQLLRGTTDQSIERQLILFLVDGNDLLAEVFPRLGPDKTGKVDLARKSPYAPDSFSWDVMPDPYSQQSEWICEAGTAWFGEGDFQFATTPPAVTPITGLKATVIVPTPIEITSPTYTVKTQTTAGGSFVSGTISTPSPSASGGFTTITIGSLTASQAYNALQITATGTAAAPGTGTITVVTPPSAPFTATAS